ncbi:MAG: ABC transporter permease [Deltaproteobacteria bacterium]|jgi:putative ABC transport system permease protein|nr:ABC transporter permease [Deltaproteobacteria bacterium]
MFFKMLFGALWRQKRKHFLIAFTVGLGVSLATAMLGVMFDVGDKVNQELKSYGANLNVVPKGTSVLGDLYNLADVGDGDGGAGDGDDAPAVLEGDYIKEDELYKIKMIFWAYNIVDFAPFLTVRVEVPGASQPVELTGTWFNKHLSLPTGDEVDTGMTAMRSWWVLNGPAGDETQDPAGVMVGAELAKKLKLKPGDVLTVSFPQTGEKADLNVRSVFESGGEEDRGVFAPLGIVQTLAGKRGLAQRVEVSALTTPENELARRAAQNPGTLTRQEWDTWYCTAYISSIAYQIEEILPSVRVKPVLRVAQSEGAILSKTQLMIVLLTMLTLLCSALAISNLVTANIMERSVEIGLLKALGASGLQVSCLVLAEILIAAFAGGIGGYLVGLGLAQFIGLSVFGSMVAVKTAVIPLGVLMVLAVTILGSVPALRALLGLRPTEVLHGR